MCKYLTKFIFLLFMATTFSVVAKNDAVKVYDRGLDGNKRHYTVICPDGNRTAIAHALGEHGKSARSGAVDVKQLQSIELADQEEFKTSSRRGSLPTADSSSSVQQTTEGLKRKFLKLIGAKSKVEVCMNSAAQCNSYESIDAAAKAACNITR